MFSYSTDFHGMSTGLRLQSPPARSMDLPDALKQLAERTTSRDDSGNSSNSSSLEHLHVLPVSQPQEPRDQQQQQHAVMPATRRQRDVLDDRMWQSAGVLLELGGYDTENPHVPLHKTVCCALCRKKQERQMKLKADSPGRNISSTQCHHQDSPLTTDMNNNSSCTVELTRIMPSESTENDRVQLCTSSPVDQPTAVASTISADTDEKVGISMTDDISVNDVTVRQDLGHADYVDSSSLTQLTDSRPRFRRSNGLDVDKARESIRRRTGGTFSKEEAGRPITDPVLLQALHTSPFVKHLNLLSPQDEKLLSKLALRKQQEHEQQLQRELAKQQWENDSKQQQLKKQQLAAQRRSADHATHATHSRKSPADPRRVSTTGNGNSSAVYRQMTAIDVRSNSKQNERTPLHRSMSARTCQHQDTNCNCGRDHNRQLVVDSSAAADRAKRLSLQSHNTVHCDDGSTECYCQRCVSNSALERKTRDVENPHLLQALERKAHVEQCLAEQKQETENYIRQLQEKQEEETKRVHVLRQEKQAQAAERARQKDRHLRLTVENARELGRHEQDELMNSHESWEESLTLAEMKAKKRREEESAIIRAELQMKIDRSKQKQAYMENELKKWQEEMIAYRELQEKHARAVAQAHIDRRREAASKDRELRERQQRDNLLRMQEQEREWKASVEAAIKSKEARSKMILHEKESLKKQAREMAILSRQMRDELRLNSSLTDVDRYV